jgi:hypothetical protein
MKFSSLEK